MSKTFIIPAGTYFLCDPCYVIPGNQWHDILDKTNLYEEMYADPERGVSAAHGTKWGDGLYEDDDGNEYPVDAGIIGLTDIRYNPNLSDYRRIEFATPVELTYNRGVIKVTDPENQENLVYIDTNA
jgi:hypothetical protein